jgi:transcriptional regulator with GAF, ATPase, and Fis domain
MGYILGNLNINTNVTNRIEALKTLTKLLLHEVESLSELSPTKHRQPTEIDISLNEKVQQYEVDLICNAMLAANGNQRQAAKMLGMKTTTLHAKIRRYEIDSLNITGQF